jgi:hemoglobin
MRSHLLRFLLLPLALALAACCCPSPCDPCRPCCPTRCCPTVDWSKVQTSNAEATLYERLGGLAAIEALVDDFLPQAAADPVIMANTQVKERLAKADLSTVRQHLVDQLCAATGGPCTYKGRSMVASHTGLGITEAEWTASQAQFSAAMTRRKIGEKEQAELLALLESTKGEIVGK